MKRLWARVGMNFEISDEEYGKFISDCRGDNAQRANAEKTFVEWVENGKGELNGESYFPEQDCFGDDSTDNVEELNFLF